MHAADRLRRADVGPSAQHDECGTSIAELSATPSKRSNEPTDTEPLGSNSTKSSRFRADVGSPGFQSAPLDRPAKRWIATRHPAGAPMKTILLAVDMAGV